MRIGSSNSGTGRRVAGPRRVPQKSGRRGMAEATGRGETQHKPARDTMADGLFRNFFFALLQRVLAENDGRQISSIGGNLLQSEGVER